MGLRVAVVGATGAVGREMLTTLAERNFPADEVIALASSKSTGAQVSFGEDQVLTVADLDSYDFTGTDIALFSAGGAIAEKYAPKAAAAGCVVIDNSSHFRMDADVPLIVPEVNADDLADFRQRNIIANPNSAELLDFYTALAIKRKTKPICTNDRMAVYIDPRSYSDFVVKSHLSMQPTVLT